MKRILSVFLLAGLIYLAGAAVPALRSSHLVLGGHGVALADTIQTAPAPAEEKGEKKENPAEEKKETPAQEKAEEKTEAHHAHHKSTATHKVDINVASKETLMKLPGVTDEAAEKIIAGRPYTSKGELTSKKILTTAEYNKISAKIKVETTKTTKTTKTTGTTK